jgi:GntR family transcriptional regulator, transcriptional repressor for pyruvate dehydrogenase complex
LNSEAKTKRSKAGVRAGALGRPGPIDPKAEQSPSGNDQEQYGLVQRRRASRSEVVARHILDLIGSGQLKPGDKLPSETELMALLDVGRSSIREATSGLALIGMLRITRRRGTVVLATALGSLSDRLREKSNYWVIRDLEEVRILLEGFAAARAAEHTDAAQLREIEEAAEKLEAKAKLEQNYFDDNTQFHLAIAKASHNSAIVFCLGSIIERFQSTRERLNWTPVVREKDVREHRLILEAIRDRQPALARALMEAHLTRNIARLEKPE